MVQGAAHEGRFLRRPAALQESCFGRLEHHCQCFGPELPQVVPSGRVRAAQIRSGYHHSSLHHLQGLQGVCHNYCQVCSFIWLFSRHFNFNFSRYTYGKPVKGEATITMYPTIFSGLIQPIFQNPVRKVVAIDGKANVEFDIVKELG
jgi:hypothetical protein